MCAKSRIRYKVTGRMAKIIMIVRAFFLLLFCPILIFVQRAWQMILGQVRDKWIEICE